MPYRFEMSVSCCILQKSGPRIMTDNKKRRRKRERRGEKREERGEEERERSTFLGKIEVSSILQLTKKKLLWVSV